MDIAEIDTFMAEAKSLLGPPPPWQEGTRKGELSASWPIADSLGIARSELRFRCTQQQKQFPSVSVIYRQHLVYRLDMVPAEECKPNPLGAIAFGLPPSVCGPHCHAWPDNRDYVHSVGFGHMPYRRPIQPQVRRLPQALLWLADDINLTIGPDQRGFDVPAQNDLFG